MALRLVTAPAEEPVSRVLAKQHLVVEHDEHDDLIDLYVSAARTLIDGRTSYLGRALITQTWELSLDGFPADAIQIPLAPLQTVSSIKYDDVDGVEQTLDPAEYVVDAKSEPGWIVVADSWPDTIDSINTVRVTFVAGYGAAAAVPAPYKQAILLVAAASYENRGALQELPRAVDDLLRPFRVWP